MKTKAQTYQVNSFLQKVIIITSLLGFIAANGMMVYWIANQYSDNHNLSGFLAYAIDITAVPLVVFLPAYFTSRQGTRQLKLFEACLFMTTVSLILGLLRQISIIPLLNSVRFADTYWASVAYTSSFTVFSLVLYVVGLVYYRKHST